MKKINVLVLLAVSVFFASLGAMASEVSAESSWAAVLSDSNLEVAFPVVHFGNTAVSVANVCYAGDQVKTRSAVSYCVDYRQDGEGLSYCAKEASAVLSTARSYLAEVCSDVVDTETGFCSRTAKVVKTYSDEYDVQVDRADASFEGAPSYAFSKKYRVPSCN